MVLAPENPLVDQITTADRADAVAAYRAEVAKRTELDRVVDDKSKTGVDTGAVVINPATGEKIPIWIADYVLMGYGTGAIMAVPGHDARDFEFAQKFGLPIRAVVLPPDEWLDQRGVEAAAYTADPRVAPDAFTGHGTSINSAGDVSLNGLPTDEAKRTIAAWLTERRYGSSEVQYKIRDWLFSRQRYWGEPIPILHGPDGAIHPVDESELPVRLPDMEDFRPTASSDPDAPPQPPLGRADSDWKFVEKDGVVYTRELNTMPNWAGSCWYYLRFIDPHNSERLVRPELERYWMGEEGVDLYVGGAEHAVLHLLYARFWHKVLFDLGYVGSDEPFRYLVNQGYIQAFAYRDERGIVVDPDVVVDQDGNLAAEVQDQPDRKFFVDGKPVAKEYGKMGKSLKNTVDPDEIRLEYGCDTLRLYEMYLGPLEQSKPWSTRDIIGVHRFLRRVWRNFVDDSGALRIAGGVDADGDNVDDGDGAVDLATTRLMHKTIERVTTDIERLSFNTAIAALIEFNSTLVSRDRIPRPVARTFVLLLSPLAPHLAEELWERLGNSTTLAFEPWPVADPRYTKDDLVTIAVQVNGKVRASIDINPATSQSEVLARARQLENVVRYVEGKTIRREIYVPGRIVNIVVS
jgi:leucyl-tRNA synthetase